MVTSALQKEPRKGGNTNSCGTCRDMRTLCKAGHLKEAVDILYQGGVSADSNTYVFLLQQCIKMKGLAEGKQVHRHIMQSGFQPNIFVYNSLVNMYAKFGSMLDARQVFDKMPGRDILTWNMLISGYGKHGFGREALDIYEQIIQERVLPDKVTFTCVLNACASLAALEKGKEVHADIIKTGIAPDIILNTALVAMYAKCGSIKDASKVFKSMAQRNVVSWSAMIAGYTKHGCGREALETYDQMIREGVTPDKITFTCILNACGSLAALDKGKGVHADIFKAGIDPDIILGTALVDMYAKCGSIKDARQEFDSMVQRNVVSWSAMIAGYAQHGCGREAFEMYKRMIQEGISPNRVTFISVLNACASLTALEKGQEVHADIIRAGIASDMILDTALIAMYSKCGSIKDARTVFGNMAKRNVFSWSAMIAGYVQHGCDREAYETYEQMVQEGVTPDITLQNTLVNMYAKCGSIKDARRVFDSMAQRDVVSWNAMIAGYAQHGWNREAIMIYEHMIGEGVTPDKVTFLSLLNVCASLSALEKGLEVHSDIVKARVVPDIMLENALVDMYSKCGSLHDAREVLDKMLVRTVVSWTAMIAGYGQHGYGMEALRLFEEMQHEGLEPDGITFVCLLSACSHGGLVDEGRYYFDSMSRDHGLNPTMEHFGCIVDLLGRAGQFDEAEDFIRKMPIEPGGLVWRALLGACRNHGHLELAERVAYTLLKLDPQDATTYVLLSSIYAAAGRWDDQAKLKRMIKDRDQKEGSA